MESSFQNPAFSPSPEDSNLHVECNIEVRNAPTNDDAVVDKVKPMETSPKLESETGHVDDESLQVSDKSELDKNEKDGEVPLSKNFFQNMTSFLRGHVGILIAVLASFMYSCQAVLMEASTRSVDPLMLTVLIAMSFTLGGFLAVIVKRTPLPTELEQYYWLFFCGLAISAYVNLLSFAIFNMEAGDVITLTYVSLILVGVLSWIMLKEPMRRLDILFSLIAFVGTAFIARPPFIFVNHVQDDVNNMYLGVAFALGAAIVISFIVNIMRKLSQLQIHAYLVIFVNGICLLVISTTICLSLDRWRLISLRDWMVSLGAGVFYFLGQILAYSALERERATLVVIALTLEIVFTFILQFVFLGTHPLWSSYVGAVLIILTCIGITLNKERTQSDSTRTKPN